MHELGQGRAVKCTSHVCYQQYKVNAFEKKPQQADGKLDMQQIRQYLRSIPPFGVKYKNKRKRKFLDSFPKGRVAVPEAKRVKDVKESFEGLCEEWERQCRLRKRFPDRIIGFKDLPKDLRIMICKYRSRTFKQLQGPICFLPLQY